jgi:gamma-glutamyltranspeptidase
LGTSGATRKRSSGRRQRVARRSRFRRTFLVGDQAPPLYAILRNPELATALRLLQKDGRDAFYRGPIAAAIVAKVQANGGVMNLKES